MKPEGKMHQTATQVKLLSPEIIIVAEAETVHKVRRQNAYYRRERQDSKYPPGSEGAV